MADDEHVIGILRRFNQAVAASCSCKAHWTFKEGITEEEVEAINKAHIAYAKRIATKPD